MVTTGITALGNGGYGARITDDDGESIIICASFKAALRSIVRELEESAEMLIDGAEYAAKAQEIRARYAPEVFA